MAAYRTMVLLLQTSLVLLLFLLRSSLGYPSYMKEIPNSENLPHPCRPEEMWHGVGHFQSAGYAQLNVFGHDFHDVHEVWTEELCNMDSDGDGMTNGRELGDPNCVWKKNSVPTRIDNITHPGICDPWDSPQCLQMPIVHPHFDTQGEWMRSICEDLQCGATNETGIQKLDLHFSDFNVPAEESSYMCQVFNVSEDLDVQMIGIKPITVLSHALHSITLLGCDADQNVSSEPYACSMTPGSRCRSILALWRPGMAGHCFYPQLGIPLGAMGFPKLAIQIHYNNPELKTKYTDSSGMRVYYTPNNRTYEAGVMVVGASYFNLPPGQKEVKVTGTCTSTCTDRMFSGPVNVTLAINRMHYTGRKMSIEVRRDGKHLTYLTNEDDYNYKKPKMFSMEAPVELLPQDEIITSCAYSTEDTNQTVMFGEASSDEMCYGFLTYYPKERILTPSCDAQSGYLWCDPVGTTYGCKDAPQFYDDTFVSTTQLYKSLKDKCQTWSPCTKQCLDFLLEQMKTNPCMKGSVWTYLRQVVLRFTPHGQEMLARISSCNGPVYDALHPAPTPTCPTPPKDPSDSAHGLQAAQIWVTLSAGLLVALLP